MPAVHIQDVKIATTIRWKEINQEEIAKTGNDDDVGCGDEEGNGDVEIFGIGGAGTALGVAESAKVTVSVALAGFPLLEQALKTTGETPFPSPSKRDLWSPRVANVTKDDIGRARGGHNYAKCPTSFWLTAFLL